MKIYSSEIIKRMRVEGCRTCPNREVIRLGKTISENRCMGMPLIAPDGSPLKNIGKLIDDEVREGGRTVHRLCPLPDEETTIKEQQ